MRTIHVAMPNGSQLQYKEEHLRTLLQSGAIPQDAMYWFEGMAEWRPIAEIYPAATTPVPAPQPANVAGPYTPQQGYDPLASQQPDRTRQVVQQAQYSPYTAAAQAAYGSGSAPQSARLFVKDPTYLTKTVIVLFWILVVIYGLMMLLSLGSAAALSTPGATPAAVLPYAAGNGLLALGLIVVTLISVVHYCKWVHRANTNVRGFGAQGLAFTPEWAVGWYFVPIMNLIRPYQAMEEICKASRSPAQWDTESVPSLLGIWWALYVISNIVGTVVSRFSFGITTVPEMHTAYIASACSGALTIAAAIALIQVVKRVYQLQLDYVEYRS